VNTIEPLDPAPTFLIVGAARSGTTALSQILAQHPDISITTPKEPHFFAFAERRVAFTGPGDNDMINRPAITDPMAYQRLVEMCGHSPHRGEGSVSSLVYATDAVANIERFAPSAKIVAILRHPAERAHSSYLYLRSRGHETLTTFEEGLAAEPARSAAGWHHMWRYRALGNYATQLEPFVSAFGRGRVHVMLHDDLCTHPEPTMSELLDFLGATPFVFDTTRQWNRGGIPVAGALHRRRVLVHRPRTLTRLARHVVPSSLRQRARPPRPMLYRPPLDPDTRRQLDEYYAPELSQLERMLDLDLSSWRTRTQEPDHVP
jgi:hypothetical protein